MSDILLASGWDCGEKELSESGLFGQQQQNAIKFSKMPKWSAHQQSLSDLANFRQMQFNWGHNDEFEEDRANLATRREHRPRTYTEFPKRTVATFKEPRQVVA